MWLAPIHHKMQQFIQKNQSFSAAYSLVHVLHQSLSQNEEFATVSFITVSMPWFIGWDIIVTLEGKYKVLISPSIPVCSSGSGFEEQNIHPWEPLYGCNKLVTKLFFKTVVKEQQLKLFWLPFMDWIDFCAILIHTYFLFLKAHVF